jgi:hypothetical protein
LVMFRSDVAGACFVHEWIGPRARNRGRSRWSSDRVNCRERLCCPTARSGVSRAGQSRRLVRRRGDALRRSSGFRAPVLPPFNIEESEWPPEPCAPQKTATQSRTTDSCQRSHPGPPRVSSPPCSGQPMPSLLLHKTSEGDTIGEGSVVQLIGFLIKAKFSNVGER